MDKNPMTARFRRLSEGRHDIYLPNSLVTRTDFPFQPGDRLTVRISGGRVIVEKAE